MKVQLKWLLTGKDSVIEDVDAILSPETTIAELKGLIQIRYGFSAKELLLVQKHLLENNVTLKSVGIVGGPADPVLTAHVVRESELEASNFDQDDRSKDDDLQEFSHADFMLAMKMLGKKVPVSDDRLMAMRLNAPRQRPAFLDAQRVNDDASVGADGSAGPPAGMPGVFGGTIETYNPKNTEIYQIVLRVRYGARRVGVDEKFGITYPGIKEPFPFWDMRTPDPFTDANHLCSPGEVCLELFYFGEFEALKNHETFLTLVQHTIESKAGVRLRMPGGIREAGCMYPLIACQIILHEMDAMELGQTFFEDFGKTKSAVPSVGPSDGTAVAGSGGGCAPQ